MDQFNLSVFVPVGSSEVEEEPPEISEDSETGGSGSDDRDDSKTV